MMILVLAFIPLLRAVADIKFSILPLCIEPNPPPFPPIYIRLLELLKFYFSRGQSSDVTDDGDASQRRLHERRLRRGAELRTDSRIRTS